MEANDFDIHRKTAIYREYAKTYDEDRRASIGEATLSERINYVASHVRAGSNVLDLGCGTGDLLRVLSPAVGARGECVGMDISPDMLELARRKLSRCVNVRLHVGDVTTRLPFEGERFDVVTALNVNQEMPLRLQESMLREARRVLKRGGVFVGYTACLSGAHEAEKCYSDAASQYLWYFYPHRDTERVLREVFPDAETAFQPSPTASPSEASGKMGFRLWTEIMSEVRNKGHDPEDVTQGVLRMRGVK